MMRRAVIALGSNLGDRSQLLLAAATAVGELDGIELVAVSPVHETAALTLAGVDASKPAYLNAVVLADTELGAGDLLAALLDIETRLGRVRAERWGDRTIDLDLIALGDERRDEVSLTLPHPRAHERDFVLRPWLEVDPHAVLPGRGAVRDLLAALEADR